MAHYILLMTLSPEGREEVLADPERVLRAGHETNIERVQAGLDPLGLVRDRDLAMIDTNLDASIEMVRRGRPLGSRRGRPITPAAT